MFATMPRLILAMLFSLVLVYMPSSVQANDSGNPAATRPADADHVLVERPALHFSIVVPKFWKLIQQTDQATVYQLPGQGGGLFLLATVTSGGAPADLAKAVKGTKEAFTAKYRDLKFNKDEAVKLDGVAAWELAFVVPVVASGGAAAGDNAAASNTATVKQTIQSIECMTSDGLVGLSFYPRQDNPEGEKEVAAVIASSHWTNRS
jgi:hypothetical protein